jgi:Na+-translocating ferredoxin:NAD+ oxidoreductase RNF subunit RnfB
MGTAVIELTVCTAYQGSGCTQCYESCPIPEQAIRLNEGLPEILSQECTGCGVCVFDCPTLGAITIHPPALIA